VEGPERRFLVNEFHNTGWLAERATGWRPRPLDFKIPYQSEITHKLVQDAFDQGDCGLSAFENSAPLHLMLLEPLLNHYRTHLDKDAESCPIT
jgi:hypothetical protein